MFNSHITTCPFITTHSYYCIDSTSTNGSTISLNMDAFPVFLSIFIASWSYKRVDHKNLSLSFHFTRCSLFYCWPVSISATWTPHFTVTRYTFIHFLLLCVCWYVK